MDWADACTLIESLGGRRHKATISIKPRAFLKDGSLRAIPPGFSATSDANLPRGRSGLLDTRMADRLAGQSPQVHIGRGKYHIRMSALGTNNVPGIVYLDGMGREIGRRYNSAWPGADLEWIDIGHRVRKHIYLHEGHPSVFEVRIDDRQGNLVASNRGWDLLDDNGSPVLFATPGYLFKPDDLMAPTIPVTTTVRVQGGKSIYRYVLPAGDWTGYVLDPTWSSQPGADEGQDTYIYRELPNTNFGTSDTLWIGNQADNVLLRTLIKFPLTSLPTSALLTSTTLSLFLIQDAATLARTFRVYRLLVPWVELQAAWNIRSAGNNWTTPGGFHAADCEQSEIGSRNYSDTETLNEFKNFPLTPTTKAGLDLGNGWLIKADTESSDAYNHASSDHATAAWRPSLTVEYSEARRRNRLHWFGLIGGMVYVA